MARIIVTDDDGTVISVLTDSDQEIGNLSRALNRTSIVDEIRSAVEKARRSEYRDENGDDTGEPPGAGEDVFERSMRAAYPERK